MDETTGLLALVMITIIMLAFIMGALAIIYTKVRQLVNLNKVLTDGMILVMLVLRDSGCRESKEGMPPEARDFLEKMGMFN